VPVDFVDGWRDPHVREGVIMDAIPVLPGTLQVAYAFGLALATSTATVRWEFPYGATDVELLADTSLRLSGAAVHGRGIVTERGRRYGRWSAGPVPPGGAISVGIDGLPIVVVERWPELAAGALALVLACGLAAVLLRGRRGLGDPTNEAG